LNSHPPNFAHQRQNEIASFLTIVATEIETLKTSYIQLREFDAKRHCNPKSGIIQYTCNCGQADHVAGWRGGVPRPHPGGLWLYLALWNHDQPQNHLLQLHTQPITEPLFLGNKQIMLLVLEGLNNQNVYPEILNILFRNGVTRHPTSPGNQV
jgi:hypothetical protein